MNVGNCLLVNMYINTFKDILQPKRGGYFVT